MKSKTQLLQSFREKFKPGSIYDGEINADAKEMEQFLLFSIDEAYRAGYREGRRPLTPTEEMTQNINRQTLSRYEEEKKL